MADYRNINIRNKRATFDYEILEEYIAGIVLVGTEIKSLRLGKASLVDSYCYFERNELWIRNVNIADPQLISFKVAVGVNKRRLTQTQRLNLCSHEHDTCYVLLENLIVKCRSFVAYVYISVVCHNNILSSFSIPTTIIHHFGTSFATFWVGGLG